MTTDVLIQVQDLKKHFPGATPIKALDGVSVDIKRGEVVVVIGPSGSGKSTFLRCLNLLEVPTGGRILFDEAQRACAPGQSAVFYEGDAVLGGGFLE